MSGSEDDAWIVAIRVGLWGCEGALIDRSGRVYASEHRIHPAPELAWGFLALDAKAVLHALIEVCHALSAEARNAGAIAAMALTTERDTALLVGSENALLTPILFGRGLPVPRREVAGPFDQSAIHTELYRRSPLRQLALWTPERVQQVRRYAGLGSLLMQRMTGHWVESSASPPVGCPVDAYRAEHEHDEALWAAMGVARSAAPLLVPPGGVMAQLTPHFSRHVGLPAYLPVLATGDATSCAMYAMEASESRWGVVLGNRLEAGWTMPEPVEPHGHRIKGPKATVQIIEPGDEAPRVLPPGEQARASIDAAEAALGDRFGWRLGAAPGRATAGLLGGPALLGSAWLEIPWGSWVMREDLARAPLGAEGLRWMAGWETGAWVGVCSGHGPWHRLRALFEGLSLELRRWRSLTRGLSEEPLRMCFEAPWHPGSSSYVADILGEPVQVWDGLSPALYGAADIGFQILGHAPFAELEGVTLRSIEPGARAPYYTDLAALHVQLNALLSPLF